ncbi:hypothetical protein ACX80W_00985 [Arthrobacter sp. TMN-37]
MTEDSKNRTAGVGGPAEPADAATAVGRGADTAGGRAAGDTAVVQSDRGAPAGGSAGSSAGAGENPSGAAVRRGPAIDGPYSSSKAVAGPFTLREVVLLASAVVIFLGTLLPFFRGEVRYANFWNTLPLFFVGIGILLPVAAAALVLGRRRGASGLRVGSLSVDQFASIAAVLAAAFFFLQTMTAFHIGPLVSLIGALGMLAATVLGPHLPFFAKDFTERSEAPAHPVARGILPTRPKPAKEPKPAKPEKAKQEKVKQHSVEVPIAGTDERSAAASTAASATAASSGSSTAASTPVAQAGAGATAAAAAAGATALGADQQSAAVAGQPSGDRTAGQGAAKAEPAGQTGAGETAAHQATAGAGAASEAQTRVHPVAEAGPRQQETISATRSADEDQVVEAFWFAVGTPRPVVDEQTGRQLFVVHPGDWEVGIEDRGTEFLVQDKRTGQIGVMRNLTNIERAPRE